MIGWISSSVSLENPTQLNFSTTRLLVGGLAVLVISGGLPISTFAAPPTLDALVPSGGKKGTETAPLAISGKTDPWPPQVWCSNPGVKIEALEEKGKFAFSIDPETESGPCWVRLFNAEGASEPRIFVVGSLPEIVEDSGQGNDGIAEAIPVESLPGVINGRLEKSQDVDAWKVALKKGQTLHARLDGYSLRSGIDPFLHLYDPDEIRVELGNDNPRNLDPRLVHEAEKDGDYVVAVMAIATPPNANVFFHGGGTTAWRLTLSTDATDLPSDAVSEVPAKDSLGIEGEKLKPLSLPIDGFGTLLSTDNGKTDRVLFSAKKDQSLRLEVRVLDHGFPTDPVLKLKKEDGSLIREVDDRKSDRNAEYLYKIPADGNYLAEVSDRFGRVGEDLRYQLEIGEEQADFLVAADQSKYSIDPGGKATIKLTVTRSGGHELPLKVEVVGLPDKISRGELTLDGKAKAGELALEAAPDAPAVSRPIQIRVTEERGEGKNAKTLLVPFSFQGSDARGPYLLDEIDHLWLTVKPKAKNDDKKN